MATPPSPEGSLVGEEKKEDNTPAVSAKVFVPHHLKQVNYWRPTVHLQAERPLPASAPPLLVPMFPLCCRCGTNVHSVPSPPTLPDDLYYALQEQPPSNDGSLPGTNHIASMEEYVIIWRGLLQAERKAQLLLYEHFSQYQHPVCFKQQTTPHGVCMTAHTAIPGMADALVQVNDTILLRPTRTLSWMLPNSTIHLVRWSPPHHVMQIQSTIQGKQRFPNKADRLTFDWLSPSQSQLLQQSHGQTKQNCLHFNLRIIPSIKPLERCWTALEWLRVSGISLETLSPTHAPVVQPLPQLLDSDQLNAEQTSFLNMVLDRTDDPSLSQIRGPMILTGPAGVGCVLLCIVFCCVVLTFSLVFELSF